MKRSGVMLMKRLSRDIYFFIFFTLQGNTPCWAHVFSLVLPEEIHYEKVTDFCCTDVQHGNRFVCCQ
ncbi:MAG: hypothetical protein ACXW01_02220, partial [Methylobacter sp.]